MVAQCARAQFLLSTGGFPFLNCASSCPGKSHMPLYGSMHGEWAACRRPPPVSDDECAAAGFGLLQNSKPHDVHAWRFGAATRRSWAWRYGPAAHGTVESGASFLLLQGLFQAGLRLRYRRGSWAEAPVTIFAYLSSKSLMNKCAVGSCHLVVEKRDFVRRPRHMTDIVGKMISE